MKLSGSLARYVRRKGWLLSAVIAVAVLLHGTPLPGQTGRCPSLSIDGEVQAGKSFTRGISPSQVFVLESIASGWIVRILPQGVPRPSHDFAELATPPYRSPNPLLISTDFAFRSQDAIAWNPREFRFFTTAAQLATASRAYEATLREPNRPAAGAALFPLLAEACTAELRMLDARIAGGTAD